MSLAATISHISPGSLTTRASGGRPSRPPPRWRWSGKSSNTSGGSWGKRWGRRPCCTCQYPKPSFQRAAPEEVREAVEVEGPELPDLEIDPVSSDKIDNGLWSWKIFLENDFYLSWLLVDYSASDKLYKWCKISQPRSASSRPITTPGKNLPVTLSLGGRRDWPGQWPKQPCLWRKLK